MTEKLIICNFCMSKGYRQTLAKIADDGSLIIRRGAHGTTIIQSSSYTLFCGCGYQCTISSGAISMNTHATQ